MSISLYLGMTESGKSHHVLKRVLPLWKRKVVFDIANCFSGDVVLVDPSDQKLTEIFTKFAAYPAYTIVIRLGRLTDEKTLFNKAVHLACGLGRAIGTKDPNERVQFVCDEADFICSPNFQTWELKHLVNKGRHDNVDGHFICRSPTTISMDIRRNCSKIATFFLNSASTVEFIKNAFKAENARNIERLRKYCRMEWTSNGVVLFFNEKNEIVKEFSRISTENR